MKYNCKKLSVLFAAVMMFVLACPATVLAAAEEEAGTPAVYATFLPFKFARSSVEVTSADIQPVGTGSGIDHKRGLQFPVPWNFSWSTFVLWR